MINKIQVTNIGKEKKWWIWCQISQCDCAQNEKLSLWLVVWSWGSSWLILRAFWILNADGWGTEEEARGKWATAKSAKVCMHCIRYHSLVKFLDAK